MNNLHYGGHLFNHLSLTTVTICSFSFLLLMLIYSSDLMTMGNNQKNSLYLFAQLTANENNPTILPIAYSLSNNLSLANLIAHGSPYYGNKSATKVIIDFSDFQCYLCKRHVDNTEQQLNSSYFQKGKAIYVFKHLPNRGFDSLLPSLAAQCLHDQGKFWEFHHLLYKNQGPIDSGWVNSANLKKFASQISDTNMTKFDLCFDNKKYKRFIEDDVKLANSLGFTETPSFIIVNRDGSNPQKIDGPKPFPFFQSAMIKLGGN